MTVKSRKDARFVEKITFSLCLSIIEFYLFIYLNLFEFSVFGKLLSEKVLQDFYSNNYSQLDFCVNFCGNVKLEVNF